MTPSPETEKMKAISQEMIDAAAKDSTLKRYQKAAAMIGAALLSAAAILWFLAELRHDVTRLQERRPAAVAEEGFKWPWED